MKTGLRTHRNVGHEGESYKWCSVDLARPVTPSRRHHALYHQSLNIMSWPWISCSLLLIAVSYYCKPNNPVQSGRVGRSPSVLRSHAEDHLALALVVVARNNDPIFAVSLGFALHVRSPCSLSILRCLSFAVSPFHSYHSFVLYSPPRPATKGAACIRPTLKEAINQILSFAFLLRPPVMVS